MFRFRTRRVIGALAATALLAAGLTATGLKESRAADAGDPGVLAQTLDDALLEAMRRSEELGYAGRYEALDPVLRRTFNFPFMARVSVGRYWRSMSGDEQRRLIDAFARLSVASFASRFNGYNGERFEIEGTKEQPRGAILVLNNLIQADGEPIAINYLMRRGGNPGHWKVIDVYLDAKYSELATKRSEFTSTIKRKGVEGLLVMIEEKIAGLAKQAGAAAD